MRKIISVGMAIVMLFSVIAFSGCENGCNTQCENDSYATTTPYHERYYFTICDCDDCNGKKDNCSNDDRVVAPSNFRITMGYVWVTGGSSDYLYIEERNEFERVSMLVWDGDKLADEHSVHVFCNELQKFVFVAFLYMEPPTDFFWDFGTNIRISALNLKLGKNTVKVVTRAFSGTVLNWELIRSCAIITINKTIKYN